MNERPLREIIKDENTKIKLKKLIIYVCVCFLIMKFSFNLDFETQLEGMVILSIFLFIALDNRVYSIFIKISRGYQVCVLATFFILISVQLTNLSEETYPFVKWQMYGSIQNFNPYYYQYDGVIKNGNTIRFIPEKAIPTLGKDRILTKLKNQIDGILAEKDKINRTSLMQIHGNTLVAAVRLYNKKFPDIPVRKVIVSQCIIPVTSFRGTSSIIRKRLWEIGIK